MKLHHKLANIFGYDLIKNKRSHHNLDNHLQKILQNKKITTVIDVGANEGQFALELRALGFKGKILSFEPIQREFKKLEELSMHDPLWEVYNCAMGSQKGFLDLNVTDSTDFSSFLKPNKFSKDYYQDKVASIVTQKAEIRLLQDIITEKGLLKESILLKTDTQGFDIEVLKGAGEYVSSLIKVIVVELSFKQIYEGMPSAIEMMAFMKDHGYGPSGFFPISRDKKTLELIEMDGVFLNQHFNFEF